MERRDCDTTEVAKLGGRLAMPPTIYPVYKSCSGQHPLGRGIEKL